MINTQPKVFSVNKLIITF